MLERFSQLAARAAANVSRRQFLGRLGAGAAAWAVAIGAVLAAPESAQAGGRKGLPCGSGSVSGCQYRNTGDSCTASFGCFGRCAYVKGTTDCGCDLGPNPPRGCD